MKIIKIILLLSALIFANELEINANKFFMDDKKGIAKAEGNIQITKQKDKLNADNLEVILKNKVPIKYTATGNVKFNAFTQDGKNILGSAEKVVYDVSSDTYTLYKNAEIREKTKDKNTGDNVIRGDEISLKQSEGSASVVGNEKRPARIIFTIEDKQKK